MLEFLFNKVADLKASNIIKKRLQRSYFSVKFAKFLRTLFLTELLLWLLFKQCRNNGHLCMLLTKSCDFVIFILGKVLLSI